MTASTTTPNATNLDKAAIGFSALCIVHCLLLPVGLALLPSAALLTMLSDEVFHLALIVLVLPTSIIALTLGCKRHRDFKVLIPGAAGLLVLCLTAVFAHDYLGESLEKAFTVIGAILVAAGHIQNYRLCQKRDCASEAPETANN